ncbi:MAG: xanthine dehydrogenase accessory factor [Gammaproteobacteria bacterium]|jgi:xanthine dehydrogenase accessory factor
MKRDVITRLQTLREEKHAIALVTRLADGQQSLVSEKVKEGELSLSDATIANIRQRLLEDLSGIITEGESELFVRVYNPPLRLILIGAVHVSQALIPMATLLGFDVTVIDPRTAFASDERFPDVTMLTDWPDEGIRALRPDHRCALVTLTHDPKLDDPALKEGLLSDAFYIGSLGSRKTHASRLERLRAEGLADESLARIHAPVGIHLGGRRPPEIALSIMAQIIQSLRLKAPS